MPSRAKSPPVVAESGEVSFEDAMGELEEIIQALDGSPAGLDELVAKYERGMGLLARCQKQLDGAQLRIEQIVRRAEGAPEISPMTPAVSGVSAAPAGHSDAPSPPSSDDEIRLF